MKKNKKLGDCFENSVNFMYKNKSVDFVVVHGLVTGTGADVKGMRYVHAWLELGNIVFDPSINMEAPLIRLKETYYMAGNIKEDEVKRYDLNGVSKMLLKYKVFGTWEIKATKEEIEYGKTLT